MDRWAPASMAAPANLVRLPVVSPRACAQLTTRVARQGRSSSRGSRSRACRARRSAASACLARIQIPGSSARARVSRSSRSRTSPLKPVAGPGRECIASSGGGESDPRRCFPVPFPALDRAVPQLARASRSSSSACRRATTSADSQRVYRLPAPRGHRRAGPVSIRRRRDGARRAAAGRTAPGLHRPWRPPARHHAKPRRVRPLVAPSPHSAGSPSPPPAAAGPPPNPSRCTARVSVPRGEVQPDPGSASAAVSVSATPRAGSAGRWHATRQGQGQRLTGQRVDEHPCGEQLTQPGTVPGLLRGARRGGHLGEPTRRPGLARATRV